MKLSNRSLYRPLGEYIIARKENNSNLRYGAELIEGVSNTGTFITTKAKTDDVNMKPYKIVRQGDFVYNPARLNIGSLSYRESEKMCLVSHLYIVFYIKEEKKNELLPEFLWLYFRRKEFLREVDFFNFGSQREEFNFNDISQLHIPVPSFERQKEIVALWQGTRNLKLQNEGLVSPLMQLCKSYFQDLKKKYKPVEIGEYIDEVDERNSDGVFGVADVRGLSTSKQIIDTKANLKGVSLTSYKLLKHNEFGYVSDTSRRGDKMSLGFNRNEATYLVSSISTVFKVKDETKLLPSYLFLQFNRPEFDRYARFNSWGSSREPFSWEDMCRVKIPIPPIEIQEAIAEIYKCANVAKEIVNEVDALINTMYPALVQKAING